MKTAAGILGIIGGILGAFAARDTVVLGNLATAFGAEGETVSALGMAGFVFSFLTITFAALTFKGSRRMPLLLLISSLLGAIFGGNYVAACLVLGIVGGILGLWKRREDVVPLKQPTKRASRSKKQMVVEELDVEEETTTKAKLLEAGKWIFYVLFGGLLFVCVVGGIVRCTESSGGAGDSVKELETATADETISPVGKLEEMFGLGSDFTDLQRENELESLKGKVVIWTLDVYEVSKNDDSYKVQTSGSEPLLTELTEKAPEVGTFITLVARNDYEHQYISNLKTGDKITIKGYIAGSFMRNLVIKPAILWDGKAAPAIVSEDNQVSATTPVEQVEPVDEGKQEAWETFQRSPVILDFNSPYQVRNTELTGAEFLQGIAACKVPFKTGENKVEVEYSGTGKFDIDYELRNKGRLEVSLEGPDDNNQFVAHVNNICSETGCRSPETLILSMDAELIKLADELQKCLRKKVQAIAADTAQAVAVNNQGGESYSQVIAEKLQAVQTLPEVEKEVAEEGPSAVNLCGGDRKTMLNCETDRGNQILVCKSSSTFTYSHGKKGAQPDILLSNGVAHIENDPTAPQSVSFKNKGTSYKVSWIGDAPSSMGGVDVTMPDGKKIKVNCR